MPLGTTSGNRSNLPKIRLDFVNWMCMCHLQHPVSDHTSSYDDSSSTGTNCSSSCTNNNWLRSCQHINFCIFIKCVRTEIWFPFHLPSCPRTMHAQLIHNKIHIEHDVHVYTIKQKRQKKINARIIVIIRCRKLLKHGHQLNDCCRHSIQQASRNKTVLYCMYCVSHSMQKHTHSTHIPDGYIKHDELSLSLFSLAPENGRLIVRQTEKCCLSFIIWYILSCDTKCRHISVEMCQHDVVYPATRSLFTVGKSNTF